MNRYEGELNDMSFFFLLKKAGSAIFHYLGKQKLVVTPSCAVTPQPKPPVIVPKAFMHPGAGHASAYMKTSGLHLFAALAKFNRHVLIHVPKSRNKF